MITDQPFLSGSTFRPLVVVSLSSLKYQVCTHSKQIRNYKGKKNQKRKMRSQGTSQDLATAEAMSNLVESTLKDNNNKNKPIWEINQGRQVGITVN